MTKKKHEVLPTPFINGWAVASHGHRILHALPSPLDLGEYGPALCGNGPIGDKGWQEIPDEPPYHRYRCSPCCNRFRVMYDEDSDLLTREDRRSYEGLVEEMDRKIGVDI